jgi:dTMP kinase
MSAEPGEGDTDAFHPTAPNDRPGWHVRLFGSPEFFRLWTAQVIASLGDWVGFFAIAFLAGELSGSNGAAAIGLVMTARILPGLLLAPLGGVVVDRLDRRTVLVACNVGRAVVVLMLPFVDQVWQLVLASFVLETFALLWAPAKEATVPNLVPTDHLTTANSLGLAAAWGTFPLGSLVFALLATVSAWVSSFGSSDLVRTDQVGVAFVFQAVAFIGSALLIRNLPIPGRRKRTKRQRIDWTLTYRQLVEGWHLIVTNHAVRAVNLGMATGLIGGGMLIPLGAAYAQDVFGAGASGYGLFVSALGFGVAGGVVVVSVLQRRLPAAKVFVGALLVSGVALFLAASAPTLGVATLFVGLLGVSVGPVYVTGFALLQAEVDDEVRGRVFATLNTLVRLCVMLSMVLGPLFASVLGSLSSSLVDGALDLPAGVSVDLPGVRLTLWLASGIIGLAGIVAMRTMRKGERHVERTAGAHPSLSRHGSR